MHKGFIILLFIVWSWVFLVIFSVSMPYNPIAKPFLKNRHYVKGILPEGFAFFTRNPREEKLYFLVEDNGKLIQDPRLRNATLNNAFGLRRRGRILNLVYSSKLMRGHYKWYKLGDSVNIDYKNEKFVSSQVKLNGFEELIGYKHFVVIRKKIVPWAYRNLSGHPEGDVFFTKLDVEHK